MRGRSPYRAMPPKSIRRQACRVGGAGQRGFRRTRGGGWARRRGRGRGQGGSWGGCRVGRRRRGRRCGGGRGEGGGWSGAGGRERRPGWSRGIGRGGRRSRRWGRRR